mmetsp:Transcript_9806/g.22638  ORF Transcript_9806/g.22638 Transcript_9806/m.22638 type:complete len:185 (-) Transcript_9806:37-591(-)
MHAQRGGVLSLVAPALRPLCHLDVPQAACAARRSPLRVFSAGCVFARLSRAGTYQLTVEGARAVAPHARRKAMLRLPSADARLLLGHPCEVVLLGQLSAEAQRQALALPVGPCMLVLAASNGGAPPLVAPARRVRSPAGLRLLLPFVAGLEYRPVAIAKALALQIEPQKIEPVVEGGAGSDKIG